MKQVAVQVQVRVKPHELSERQMMSTEVMETRTSAHTACVCVCVQGLPGVVPGKQRWWLHDRHTLAARENVPTLQMRNTKIIRNEVSDSAMRTKLSLGGMTANYGCDDVFLFFFQLLLQFSHLSGTERVRFGCLFFVCVLWFAASSLLMFDLGHKEQEQGMPSVHHLSQMPVYQQCINLCFFKSRNWVLLSPFSQNSACFWFPVGSIHFWLIWKSEHILETCSSCALHHSTCSPPRLVFVKTSLAAQTFKHMKDIIAWKNVWRKWTQTSRWQRLFPHEQVSSVCWLSFRMHRDECVRVCKRARRLLKSDKHTFVCCCFSDLKRPTLRCDSSRGEADNISRLGFIIRSWESSSVVKRQTGRVIIAFQLRLYFILCCDSALYCVFFN